MFLIPKSKVSTLDHEHSEIGRNHALPRIAACRVCGCKELLNILDLGEHYIIDFPEIEQTGTRAPLQLLLCTGCGLVQLGHTVPRELLYRRYWYRSGISGTMVRALADIVKSAENLVNLKPKDIVIDIGANDGTLLNCFSDRKIRRVGFEPSENLVAYAKHSGDIVNEFFNAESFLSRYPNERAKVITAIAMFYDLDDPNQFVADIKRILDPEGLFIIQMNYLCTMVERNTFDNICHEHLEYYSLGSLQFLLQSHGLEIFDVELNEVNGGSFRIYVRHKGSKLGGEVCDTVAELSAYESRLGTNRIETYLAFADRIKEIAGKLHQFVANEVRSGRRIYVNGASTRGNTILQVARLDHSMIVAAADRNPDKWGRRMVGSNIPIISKEQARREKPDYYLVLPYAFLNEIMQEEETYLEAGGRFIVPIPYPHVITSKGKSYI